MANPSSPQPAGQSGPAAPERRSGGHVTVALKHPHGLVLRLFDMVDHDEPMYGGGTREVRQAVLRADAAPVRLYGYGAPLGQAPLNLEGEPILVMGGYALTPNVPEDFWLEWLSQNEKSDIVQNKLIYAASRQVDASAQAREQKAVRSGLEALNVESGKDQRVNRKIARMATTEAT